MAGKVKLLCVCGPTASGKTTLAVELAKRLNGEVVSADSMQIYKGLHIGTAAPSREEMQGVPHHLIGVLEPGTPCSAADYAAMAGQAVQEISARGRLPVLCGGTGLYLRSFLEGIAFARQPENADVRRRLQQELAQKGPGPLYGRLCRLDPQGAAAIHQNNHTRLLRALELYEATGQTAAQRAAASKPQEAPYEPLVLALAFADRAQLYARIDARVDAMMAQGLLKEAEQVYAHRASWPGVAQAIGYKEFFPYFEDAAPLAQCIAALKQASRRYAKRQLTWFRHMPGVTWLPAGESSVQLAQQAWQEFCR